MTTKFDQFPKASKLQQYEGSIQPLSQEPKSRLSSQPPVRTNQSSWLRWFYNLPVGKKQLAVLLASEALSFVGFASLGTVLIANNLKNQLENQKSSQLDAVYLRQPTGEFSVGTPLGPSQTADIKPEQMAEALRKSSLLQEAAKSPEKPITKQVDIAGKNYNLIAQVIPETIGRKESVVGSNSTPILVRSTAIDNGEDTLFNNTLWIQLGIFAFVAAADVLLATLLLKAIAAPLQRLRQSTQEFASGDRGARAEVFAPDEVGQVATAFNELADTLTNYEATVTEQARRQEIEAKRVQIFADLTLRIRQSLSAKEILETTVREVRNVLASDRVIIYRFEEDWSGTVIAESVAPGWTQAFQESIDDPCFRERHIKQYQNGRVRALNNIYEAGLTDCHLKTLEQFEVKANLVAPILKDKELMGLMITHHCAAPHAWQNSEIDLFTQLAIQVGFALDQAALLEQVELARKEAELISQEQRQQKETLQLQLIEMLSDIESASTGDLTVRAEVTAGEIGTVADFFNAIIESLRQIVTQVKKAAREVNTSVGTNSSAIQKLADEALKQAEEITRTLDSVDQMTLSIQAVAEKANKAAEVARTASTTAQASGAAMDRTVASILSLRETVAETAKKVKRLGESSQEISKVVSLINQIALQTNLLSINASIEAARAGEEGRGFAVVAEEVGQLAAQSAQATKEIEQIVENIQLGTSEVVRAMELGTSQVVEGTHMVEDTKHSLGQILEVSRQIDQLVQSISEATVSQTQTSQSVASLMKAIAKVSEHTCESSRQVSSSLQETVEVAQQLQASVGVFKTGV